MYGTIIIENGSTIKAQLSANDYYRVTFPNVVLEEYHGVDVRYHIGEDATSRASNLVDLYYPLDWLNISGYGETFNTSALENLERLLHYCIESELDLEAKNHYVILTQCVDIKTPVSEKLTEIMFENFGFEGFYLSPRTTLAIHASGRTTGLILRAGHSKSLTVPHYQGKASQDYQINNFSGQSLTEILAEELKRPRLSFTTLSELETVADIKESLCYFRQSTEENTETREPKQFELPDGFIIDVTAEASNLPERLLSDSSSSRGFVSLIGDTLINTALEYRPELLRNVVLHGGTTLFPGIKERLSLELKMKHPTEEVRVIAPKDRRYSALIGGSAISSLSSFSNTLISRHEYDEFGPSLIRYRF